jgi:polyhydroxybutyrate depolymerase
MKFSFKQIVSVLLLIVMQQIVFAQETSINFSFNGKNRSAILYVPPSYNINKPHTLVLALHGTTQLNTVYRDLINIYPIADTANFFVLIPLGLVDPLAGYTWNSGAGLNGYYPNATINDVDYLLALVDSVKAKYNINAQNVFATGFSMGGFMSNRLACETNVFKAIASVSGTIGSGITCNAQNSLPVLHIHGTADAVVPFANSNLGLDADSVVNYWVNKNNCTTTPTVTNFTDAFADGITAQHFLYPQNTTKHDVEFIKITNGAHIWYNQHRCLHYKSNLGFF